MRQILLLILLFFVGQWFFKTLRRAQTQSPQARPGVDPRQPGQGARRANGGAAGAETGTAVLAEPMVRCAECGVHAPRSESVSVGEQSFCSAAHARAYDARKTSQNRPAR
ncbi:MULTISPECIES: PP0621 family protein [unclassified Paraburkholderia]|uniref:PP0621 family protein n=1 Tax=unclassified Paraburkholderia TaxID=2615204 RepID=UPI002AB1FFF7|nr:MULTISPECIES: PP0621 family protein [unclassified Paraburkholderia]